jgi:glycosyltransferase involved in cell wall biosynthesis
VTSQPLVSVVLPTHNRARELCWSVQSVLSQSMQDLELLVIDDASTDNTYEVVNGFSDSRIRYIRTDRRVGGGEARNIGIRESGASVIAFQDSDDEWRCHKLRLCCEALLGNPTIDAVFSAYWRIDGRQVYYVPRNPPQHKNTSMHRALLAGNLVGTPTAVVRAAALRAVGGFDAKLPRYQDWDLFLRLSARSELHFIEEPLVLAHVTPNSISKDTEAHRDALIRLYDKYKVEIRKDPSLDAHWLSFIGRAMIATGDLSAGRSRILDAVMLKPTSLTHLARILLSIPGVYALYDRMMRGASIR